MQRTPVDQMATLQEARNVLVIFKGKEASNERLKCPFIGLSLEAASVYAPLLVAPGISIQQQFDALIPLLRMLLRIANPEGNRIG